MIDLSNIDTEYEIFKEADKIREGFKSWRRRSCNNDLEDYNPFVERMPTEKEDLEFIQNKYSPNAGWKINVSSDAGINNDNRVSYISGEGLNRFNSLMRAVKAHYDCSFVQPSGLFIYPINGYCGWHTNDKNKGKRIYIVWAAEDNKSYFRYQDPTTKEIKTIWDKKGWKINTFDVDPSNSYWHCVGSNTTRLSIGFRAEPLIRSAELQIHQLFERNRILWWNIINKTDQYFNYHHCYCSKNSCDKRNWQILNGKDITFPFTRIDYLMSKRPEKNLINNLSFYFKNNPLEILKNKEFMKIYDSINLNLPIIVVSTRINPDKCGLRVIYGSHVICKRIIESYKLKNYISIDNSGSVIVNDNDILNPSSDKRFGHINSCSIYIINEFDFLNLLLMNMKDNIIKNRKLNKK